MHEQSSEKCYPRCREVLNRFILSFSRIFVLSVEVDKLFAKNSELLMGVFH